MILKNEDIKEVIIEIPERHRHIKTVIHLKDGEEIVMQEATVANMCRAFMTLKTHPSKKSIKLEGRWLAGDEKKEGYAEWQLLEEK